MTLPEAKAPQFYEKTACKQRPAVQIAPMIFPSHDARCFAVHRYIASKKQEWDAFVTSARNGTFLLCRDYMDYHSDRFTDHSLMIYQGETLMAVLPANLRSDGTLLSHEGLTYGGLVLPRDAKLTQVLACFHVLLRYLDEARIPRLKYKQIPAFYSTLPDDDVSYALFLLGAKLYRRDCAATVALTDRLPLRKGHHSTVVKARKLGVQIIAEDSFQPFWEQVLSPRLEDRYGVKPVHSLEEIALLATRFPGQIKQFSAYCGDEIVAGITIYETPTVAHAQYSAATEKGRKIGAPTYLAQWLIEHYQDKQYFDFGISNEDNGTVLNHGLQEWKEGFGARSFAHNFYEVDTARYAALEKILGQPEVVLVPPLPSHLPTVTATEQFAPLPEAPVVAMQTNAPSKPSLRMRFAHLLHLVTGVTLDEFALQAGSVVMRAACV